MVRPPAPESTGQGRKQRYERVERAKSRSKIVHDTVSVPPADEVKTRPNAKNGSHGTLASSRPGPDRQPRDRSPHHARSHVTSALRASLARRDVHSTTGKKRAGLLRPSPSAVGTALSALDPKNPVPPKTGWTNQTRGGSPGSSHDPGRSAGSISRSSVRNPCCPCHDSGPNTISCPSSLRSFPGEPGEYAGPHCPASPRSKIRSRNSLKTGGFLHSGWRDFFDRSADRSSDGAPRRARP